MVLRHLCRPRDPCGAEIKAGAVSINDALALSIAELDSQKSSLNLSLFISLFQRFAMLSMSKQIDAAFILNVLLNQILD